MIKKKNFYFLRHGETDFNAGKLIHDDTDIALNETGRNQANLIQPIIAKLPIQTICVSPLRRARETAEIAAAQLNCSMVVVEDLRECNSDEWLSMIEYKFHDNVQIFMQRTLIGINQALAYPDPVLIIAHGGIHWALCHYMNVQDHAKIIDNCVPVHFSVTEKSEWKAHCLIK
jgi:uncharacterized phosphatase